MSDKLLKNALGEELDYIEPDKSKILEEPKKIDGNLESEILFKSGIEDITVSENGVILEESIEFLEPVEPEYVSEEVLFKDDGEEITFFDDDLSVIENSVINEDVANELLSSTDNNVSTADKFQMEFGDLNDAISNALSITNDEPTKVVKKPFAVKMFDADPVILERYNELKNYIMAFKKIKSRISNTSDTFNIGREQLFKLSTSGKSLKLYLNLDVSTIESRFNIIDASNTKSYEQVPAFLRIKSNRAMKYAYELIDRVIEKFNLIKNTKYENQDYIAELKEIAESKNLA